MKDPTQNKPKLTDQILTGSQALDDCQVKEEKLEEVLPTMKDPTQKKPKLTDQILTGSQAFRNGDK